MEKENQKEFKEENLNWNNKKEVLKSGRFRDYETEDRNCFDTDKNNKVGWIDFNSNECSWLGLQKDRLHDCFKSNHNNSSLVMDFRHTS